MIKHGQKAGCGRDWRGILAGIAVPNPFCWKAISGHDQSFHGSSTRARSDRDGQWKR